MVAITFKRNEKEIKKDFDEYMDLVEFAILNNIKDEELVSINLYGEEITGGINGLAIYTLREINDVREARKQALEDEDCEYFDDSEAEEFEDDEYEDSDFYDDDYDECEECADDELEEDEIDEVKNKIKDFEKFLDDHLSIFGC